MFVRRLRIIAFFIGVALLLWLPFEDTGVAAVLAFSVLISSWWAVRFLARAANGGQNMILRHMSLGVLAGLAVAPLALLLMALKTGLHGHSMPDFTVEQIQAVLASTLVWMLAGVLLGLGVGLVRAHRGAPNAYRE